jgi:hypothetical protein
MSMHKFASGLLLVFLASTQAAHAEQAFSAGLRAGTLGLGLEASWKPLKYLDIRIGGNTFTFNDDRAQAGIEYEQELTLESFYATAKILFNDSPMRLTLCAYANGNELFMVNDSMQDQDIGGVVYPGGGIGTLTSTTTFSSTAPYFGIGYDFTIKGKIGMSVDFGVLWQGEPIVELASDGALAGDPSFQAALEAERRELEDEMSDFKAWPVLQVGVVYRF